MIDGTGVPPDSSVFVHIQNGLIRDIGQSFDYELSENDKTIDLKGATILPGFFNTHIHSGVIIRDTLSHGDSSGR